mmetsp:Transcript_462/g.835  ORF Transcript_462/g.835 Transcript_462/m.835 type:complete len:366 (-) Transcript_462:200-1297(-)|eukprot:CAMPEP_0182447418 /NCGR_PEP_ID=MMETSP1172-20130603/15856_1 /TAXON_ID=708627 /ORGANISM="Timspurckia oligopyrenoides, Strain CCMP3278" /LENGTH=365 /DNA_ID=CAMNT_0024643851 /DNA_START=96 /DNA_END=1193 /DNA_ORIENTATION=-
MASSAALWKRYERFMGTGEFYDAEQACRSAYFRSMHSANKIQDAEQIQSIHKSSLNLLRIGADQMLDAFQVHSASALLMEAIKHVREHLSSATMDQSTVDDMKSLESVCGKFLEIEGKDNKLRREDLFGEQLRVVVALIALVNKFDAELGHTVSTLMTRNSVVDLRNSLEYMAAIACWKLQRYEESQKYFVGLGFARMNAFGNMLAEWSSVEHMSIRSERYLFLTRAVLLKLKTSPTPNSDLSRIDIANCLNELITAFKTYRKGSITFNPDESIDFLFHFVTILVSAVEKNSQSTYKIICDVYSASLARDPSFQAMLDIIGSKWFGVQPNRTPANGMFGSLFGDMMRGLSGGPSSSATQPPGRLI